MKLCHVLPVVYAGCLALSLFGCGGNENGSGGDGASSTQVTSGEAAERAAGESTANDASETPETSGNMNNGYLEIDGQQLDVSQAGSDFLQNPLAGSKYYGKQAAVVSEVEQIVAPGYAESVTRDNEKDPTEVYVFDNGCLFLRGGYIVDISDDMKSVAASLAKGDKVKVTGTIEAFNNYGAVVFVDEGNRFSEYDSDVIIEKAE